MNSIFSTTPRDVRHQNRATIVYNLREKGYTNKQIASQLGIDVKKVPGLVLAGSRKVS